MSHTLRRHLADPPDWAMPFWASAVVIAGLIVWALYYPTRLAVAAWYVLRYDLPVVATALRVLVAGLCRPLRLVSGISTATFLVLAIIVTLRDQAPDPFLFFALVTMGVFTICTFIIDSRRI